MGWQEKINLEEVRRAVADYMKSEGCSCCRDVETHEKNEKKLAELLNVEQYSDGSGYNFNKYATQPVNIDEEKNG